AAGPDDLHEAVLDAQPLHTPTLRPEHGAVGQRSVGHEGPVRADDTVEAEALAQQTGDDVLVVAETDLFEAYPDRTTEVRHDLRRAGVERRLEHLQVVLEHPAGIDLILPVREVRVLPVELRAAAREVLRHARDGRRSELLPLEAAHICSDEPARKLGVLAE